MILSAASISSLFEQAARIIEKDTISMPWPSIHPTLTVPYFDREMYKAVNLNARASQQFDGLDLPFDDIPTLRFFFNLGVQQSRAVLLSQFHAKLINGSHPLTDQTVVSSHRSTSRESDTSSSSWASSPTKIPSEISGARDASKYA